MASTEAQKRASRRYYENKARNKQATISITMTKEQATNDRATLAAHGLTPLQAWRRLMDELNDNKQ